MIRALCFGGLLVLGACRGLPVASAEPQAVAIRWTSETMPWRPGPATLPPGARVAVLEGDPGRPGIFTMRLEIPAGSLIPLHTHPRPERVTVLSGEVGVTLGAASTERTRERFHAGDYYVNPPDVPHEVEFVETSVLQITGEGPWEIHRL